MSSSRVCTATSFATPKSLLLPRQNLSKHISLPRPYHTRNPLLPRCSLSVPHYCHTTATPLPYMSASQHPSRIGECQILRVGPFFRQSTLLIQSCNIIKIMLPNFYLAIHDCTIQYYTVCIILYIIYIYILTYTLIYIIYISKKIQEFKYIRLVTKLYN